MTTVRDGAQKAATELGGSNKVVYTSPSEATGAAQIPFVQQLISQKVDVIAISGSDLNGAAAELKKAQAQGIKVITFDSDVAPDARSLFINQAKTDELGTGMLDSMSDLLDGKGEFAILSSTQTAVNQNAWIADIKKRLASEAKFSGMKLVDVVYGEEKADVSANRAKELVTTHPNLKGIIVPAGISLPAAATALDEIVPGPNSTTVRSAKDLKPWIRRARSLAGAVTPPLARPTRAASGSSARGRWR